MNTAPPRVDPHKSNDRAALEAAYVVIARLLHTYEDMTIEEACTEAETLIRVQAGVKPDGTGLLKPDEPGA